MPSIPSEFHFKQGNFSCEEIRNSLSQNGWVLIKSLFSKAEIATLRQKAYVSDENGYADCDLLSNPNLYEILGDDRILHLMNTLLQARTVYFRDSTYMILSKTGRISHKFHKDCVDRLDNEGPDWKSPYSVLRCGIYLQDHKHHSQGIVFRNGSHHTTDLRHGKLVNVPSEPGDVVVWYLTTSHTGSARRMRLFKNFVICDVGPKKFRTRMWHRLPSVFIQKPAADRVALFLTYGKDDHHLKRYITYLTNRLDVVKRLQKSKSILLPEILTMFEDKPLHIKDLAEQVKAVDLDTLVGKPIIPY